MLRLLPATLLASAMLLIPATAHADVELGGAITLRAVDAHHATLAFASDALPAKPDGALDARVVMAPGKRASALTKAGRHGDDTRYTATITSKHAFRVNSRYTVRLKIAGQDDIVRQIKLIDNRR